MDRGSLEADAADVRKVFAVEHEVEHTGCTVAAVTLLAEDDIV